MVVLQISCECGEDWELTSEDAITRWRGELMESNGVHLGFCPECCNIRHTELSTIDRENDTVACATLQQVAISAEEATSGSMRSFSRRLDDVVGLDPDRLSICSRCNESILSEHKQEGPDAPAIGWEYYECPHCGTQMRPEVVE